MDTPRLSVVMPTYRRTEDVLHCLESLRAQDIRDFEVLVVDNFPEGDLRDRMERLQLLSPENEPEIRYVPEPRLGLHHARHAGARAARTDLLLYIDDDATASPGWARAYAEAFERDAGVAAASGPIDPQWAEEPPAWLARLATTPPMFGPYALIRREAIEHEDRGILFGANMALRRPVLFEAGGFHPEAFGAIWLGDGESGLNRTLWERGARVGWIEGASVTHRIPSERMSLAYLRVWGRKSGAAVSYRAYHPSIPARPLLLRDAVFHIFRGAVYAIRSLRASDQADTAWKALQASFSSARVRYALRLLFDSRLRQLVEREDWLES